MAPSARLRLLLIASVSYGKTTTRVFAVASFADAGASARYQGLLTFKFHELGLREDETKCQISRAAADHSREWLGTNATGNQLDQRSIGHYPGAVKMMHNVDRFLLPMQGICVFA